VQGRKREGLELEEPAVAAGEVPALIPILENGIQFEVDPWGGQKTGFFLDQRDKRNALRRYTHNKRVLNCFSYTGGFSVYAALSDSETRVISVDSSEPAVETAYQHFQLNGLDPELHQFLIADAFDYMEQAVEQGELFDVIVLDPPAFAKSQSARAQAIKGYRRLNMLGIQLLRPGGILLSCSCSGPIEMDDLLSVISQSAQHFKREVQLLEMYNVSIDHPMHLAMPETSYLKTVFCRVN
jgi:23S rRNA (cytosine1962-C5)-methyltransferase